MSSFSLWDQFSNRGYARKEEFNKRTYYTAVKNSGVHDRQVRKEDLSTDQVCAVHEVMSRLLDTSNEENGLVTLGGLAGTGKSTMIPIIAEAWDGAEDIGFACPTGKAVTVLKRKLHAARVPAVGVLGTIHSIIYYPVVDNGITIGWEKRKPPLISVYGKEIKKLIVDEASMVSLETLNDIRSLGITVLAVGDHGQLPPINAEPVLMDPDVKLETIHRQAEGNPIIQLAQYVRRTGYLPRQLPSCAEIEYVDQPLMNQTILDSRSRLGLDSVTLVRTNRERLQLNKLGRQSNVPAVGDTVICLRNSPPVYNGMRGVVRALRSYKGFWHLLDVEFPDDGLRMEGLAVNAQFEEATTYQSAQQLQDTIGYPAKTPMGLLFDYGYTLTVHKAQGSAFDEVVLCPYRFASDSDQEYARWLYTAVTRAASRLKIVRY